MFLIIIFTEKKSAFNANSVDLNQTPHVGSTLFAYVPLTGRLA